MVRTMLPRRHGTNTERTPELPYVVQALRTR